jgi:hypothetical protein
LGVIAAAVIVLAIILATSVDFGGGKKVPPPAKLPPLTKKYTDNALGASGLLPADWNGIGGPGFVRLANRGGTAVVAITGHQGITGSSQAHLSAAVNGLRRTFHSVTIKARGTAVVGMPAPFVVAYAENSRHVPLRILVASPQGAHHEYTVEAFNSRKAPQKDLVETQQVVIALHLTP